MKRYPHSLLLPAARAMAVVALALDPAIAGAQAAKPFDFSIRNIMRGPELYGRPPENVRWSADDRWIFELFERYLPMGATGK